MKKAKISVSSYTQFLYADCPYCRDRVIRVNPVQKTARCPSVACVHRFKLIREENDMPPKDISYIVTGRDSLCEDMQKAMGLDAWTGCLCSLDACRHMWEKAIKRPVGDFVCTGFDLSYLGPKMYEACFYLYNPSTDTYEDRTVQDTSPTVAVCLAYLLCFSPGPNTQDLLKRFAETG